MAENLDPEQVEQFNRNMHELNDILPAVASGLAGMAGVQKQTQTNQTNNTNAVKANTEVTSANNAAKKEELEAAKNVKKALDAAATSLSGLTNALLKSEVSFAKYNSALLSAGDAVLALSKNFGLGGQAFGQLIKGVTVVTQLYTQQADAVLKASDEMSKMGTAGQLTSKEILDMAHGAGLFSGNLEIFTKSVKSVGTGMMSLGSTVGEGTQNFAKMVAVSREQREAFQRLGLSQEELMESQASYVKLQELSGKNLSLQTQDAKTLKAASLEYTENLLKLSALTGKDIKTLEKDKQIANEQFEEMVRTRAEDEKIRKLTAEGRLEEAQKIEAEQKARKQFVEQAVSRFGQETGLQLGRLARTGAYDQFTSGLANLGVDAAKLSKDLKNTKPGDDINKLFDKNAKDITDKVSSTVGNLDTALQFGGPELGKQFGINQELLSKTAQMSGKNLDKAREEADKAIGDPSKGVTGLKVATDAAQVARNNLTTAEITAKVTLDKLVASANPLISGLNSTTIALTALAAATYAAVKGLGQIAAGKAAGGPAGDALKKSGKSTFGGAKLAGAGAIAGLGLGMAANVAKESGHEKTGAALDIASQTASFAAMGAMAGPIGAAIGAGAGLALGLYQNRNALFKKKPSDVLDFTGNSGSEAAFMELAQPLQERVMAAASEYFEATGKKLTVNSAKRSSEDQQRLYDETVQAGRPGKGPTGMAVGKPGNSKHETGNAIDIQQGKSDNDVVGILAKHGLIQTVPGDPVHFEMPQMAKGGIVSDPTVALIGEGKSSEAVVPLNQDSILMDLAQTSKSSQVNMAEIMSTLFEKMYEKLDDVKSELSDLNATQSDIKKYSMT